MAFGQLGGPDFSNAGRLDFHAVLLLLELVIRHFEVRDARLMMEESVVREETEPRRRVFGQLLGNNQFLEWCPRLYAVIFILFMLTFFSAIIFWIASLTPFGGRIVSTLSRQLTQVHGEERWAMAQAQKE